MSAAAMLFVDTEGRILLIERTWRAGLVLPGGMIEDGELPAGAAEREVTEELGVARAAGRLLVHDTREGMDHYVFDGGLTPDDSELAPDYGGEVASLHRLAERDAIAQHSERGRARLEVALSARHSGGTATLR